MIATLLFLLSQGRRLFTVPEANLAR
jgi:hypothetical protein